MISIWLVITVFLMPLSMAFGDDMGGSGILSFNIMTDFVFLSDVIKNLNTGILDDMDFAVMVRSQTSLKY